jgi:hypothetical protein
MRKIWSISGALSFFFNVAAGGREKKGTFVLFFSQKLDF